MLTSALPTGEVATTLRRPSGGRLTIGGFFPAMGGVHLGLVAADPQVYRDFAQHALLGLVRDGWRDIVMSTPAVYGLLLMAGEVTAGARDLDRTGAPR